MINIANIEDLLEVSANLHVGPKILLDKEDMTIMHSIARQVFKGTALTDRQYALMKEKLLKYKSQFVNLDCNFEYAIEQLRNPLRQIDRSKYIKIVQSNEENSLKEFEKNVKWIKIRFPFKKSIIMDIQTISNKCKNYHHLKGSHEHYFELTDINIDLVINQFIDKEFEIDQTLLDRYKNIKEIKDNKTLYIPYFDGENIHNISANAIDFLKKEIDDISKNNFVKVVDRSIKYGFVVNKKQPTSLTEKIAFRDEYQVHIKPSRVSLQELMTSIYNLDRFPMLVILDERYALTQLDSIYKIFRDMLPRSEQAVMFRKEGHDDFNVYVKDKGLNNWVDNNTKIVYINNKKVPKTLLKSDWSPITSLSFDSFNNKEISVYANQFVDLFVSYEENLSPFKKYSRFHG